MGAKNVSEYDQIMPQSQTTDQLSLPLQCDCKTSVALFEVPWVCLRFAILVFPDHTDLLFLTNTVYHSSQRNNQIKLPHHDRTKESDV